MMGEESSGASSAVDISQDEFLYEVFENQKYMGGSWVPHPRVPWSTRTSPLEPSESPEEISPNADWRWATNWRLCIDRKMADREGWTYATRLKRFEDASRPLKAERGWNDQVRRRLYVRMMMKVCGEQSEVEIVQGIKCGLESIQRSRSRLQQMFLTSPDAINDDEILSLVNTIQENIADILSQIDMIRLNPEAYPATCESVGQLRKDVKKEQTSINSAVERAKADIHRSSIGPSIAQKTVSSKQGKSCGIGASASTKSRSEFRSTIINRGSETKSRNEKFPTSDLKKETTDRHSITYGMVETKGKDLARNANVISATPVVSSGRFQPSILSKESCTSSTQQNGVFLERVLFEQEVEKKLILIDEVTVNEQIIEERSVSIENIKRGIADMNSMYINLSKVVQLQQEKISCLCEEVDEANENAEDALNSTIAAQKLSKTSSCSLS